MDTYSSYSCVLDQLKSGLLYIFSGFSDNKTHFALTTSYYLVYNRTSHSVKLPGFSFSDLDIFRRGNDVTKLAPNFAFSIHITAYLMTVSKRPCYKDLKTEKKLKFVYPLKIYNLFENFISPH